MSIEEIFKNAEVTNESINGEINRVAITYDEYDFLTNKIGSENIYKGYGDSVIELDYHSEFIPLIDGARNNK